mgnify:CR=1 FL=1
MSSKYICFVCGRSLTIDLVYKVFNYCILVDTSLRETSIYICADCQKDPTYKYLKDLLDALSINSRLAKSTLASYKQSYSSVQREHLRIKSLEEGLELDKLEKDLTK